MIVRCERVQATLVRGRRFEVGAQHHALGQHIGKGVVQVGREVDAAFRLGHARGTPAVFAQHVAPAFRQVAAQHAIELGTRAGRQRGAARLPRLVLRLRTPTHLVPAALHRRRNLERRMRPIERRTRGLRVGLEQARAVAAAQALQTRDAACDDGAAGEQRRPRVAARCVERCRHRLDIVAIDFHHVPARDTATRGHVLADRQLGRAVVGDAVVVPQQHQLGEAQVAGERDHFLADAFLQATVADEGIGEMVDQAGTETCAQKRFGDRHAQRIGDALAERAGRHFDAGGRVDLGVPGAVRAEFAKRLDLLDRDAFVAGQVQQRIQQHRAVAVRQHDPVAVGPGRIGGVEFEMARIQRGRDFGHAERHALMAFAGTDDGVDRQEADRVRERWQIGLRPRFADRHQASQPLIVRPIACAEMP